MIIPEYKNIKLQLEIAAHFPLCVILCTNSHKRSEQQEWTVGLNTNTMGTRRLQSIFTFVGTDIDSLTLSCRTKVLLTPGGVTLSLDNNSGYFCSKCPGPG